MSRQRRTKGQNTAKALQKRYSAMSTDESWSWQMQYQARGVRKRNNAPGKENRQQVPYEQPVVVWNVVWA